MGNSIKTRDGVNISLSIPARISSFEEIDEISHTTNARLDVFFIGKTGDIREFTQEFAEKLIKTLPGTPVVAFYDEEEGDFKGHNDTQYVYGYVPEDAIPEFVEKDGKKWAQVDIKLFTERDDNIGNIAKKIIGKQQSLELNPDTVNWELIYINNKLTKIKFIDGSFYGLSVLGDDQNPAFAGSGFYDPDVVEKFRAIAQQTQPIKTGRKIQMNKEQFLSLGITDKCRELSKAIRAKEEYKDLDFYVVDFNEEEVIIQVYTEDNGMELYAAKYSWIEDDKYVVGDLKRVVCTYKEVKEEKTASPAFVKDSSDDKANCAKEDDTTQCAKEEDTSKCATDDDKSKCAEDDKSKCAEDDKSKYAEDDKNKCVDNDKTKCTTDPNNASSTFVEEGNKEDAKFAAKEKEEKEDDSKDSSSDFAALSDKEREELNALRREKKLALIDSFSKFLNEEALKKFKEKVDTIDYEELEQELKVQSFELIKTKVTEQPATFSVILPSVEQTKGSSLDDTVAELLNKR